MILYRIAALLSFSVTWGRFSTTQNVDSPDSESSYCMFCSCSHHIPLHHFHISQFGHIIIRYLLLCLVMCPFPGYTSLHSYYLFTYITRLCQSSPHTSLHSLIATSLSTYATHLLNTYILMHTYHATFHRPNFNFLGNWLFTHLVLPLTRGAESPHQSIPVTVLNV